MKLYFPIFFILVILFSACQKELSFSNGGIPAGGNTGGTAQYSLGDSNNSCSGAVVNGTYTAGTAAVAANTVVLDVEVDSAGTYNIASSAVNGISFTGSGTFSTTGHQTLTLTATGTPTNSGNFTYTAGTAACAFIITVAPAPVNPTANCKDCEYFPSCVGSKYTFADTINGTAYELVSEYTASVDTTIAGTTFQKITYTTSPAALASNTAMYLNCSNGVTTLKAYSSVTIISGTEVIAATTRPIMANAAVSDTWTDVNDLPGGAGTYDSRFSVVEKGISWTAGGHTFNDVIHIHLSTGSTFMGTYLESVTTEYYYAKGVGMIEAESTNVLTGETVLHQVIKSYFIP